MSEPIWCDVRGHYCRCHDFGKRCDDFDEDVPNEDRAGAVGRHVMERLDMAPGPRVVNLRRKRDGQLENPAVLVGIGVIRGRSVIPSRGDVQALRQREDAGLGLLPHAVKRQLAKGAQENVPQHPDARSSPHGDISHMTAHTLSRDEIETLCAELAADAGQETAIQALVLRDMALECLEARIGQRPEARPIYYANPQQLPDRGDAVNLARNWLDAQKPNGGMKITTKGIRTLAEAVMLMDAWIREVTTPQRVPEGNKP